jgi:hypothetical protein
MGNPMKIQEMNTAKLQRLENPRFHKAFCGKPGFRLNALKAYAEKVEFITDGYTTDVDELAEQVADSLKIFNPSEDCLIPAGTGIINILVGYYLSSQFPNSSIVIAFFQREITKHDRSIVPEDYQFYRFYPKALLELI